MNVCFISLGCSKNLVVTETVIGMFKKHGYNIVNDEDSADIIIVNTCGFIESAKDEAIKTILEMADYKDKNCKYLIVMGCLVQRYKEELKKELGEVDLFISIREYDTMWEQISNLVNHKKEIDRLDFHNRVITTGTNMAYLKIAEGCSNCCTYCAIPLIQGRFISREFDDIITEAKELARDGYREIVVIAQDTTKYGIDLYGKSRLAELLTELSSIDGIEWIRFLYSYPESIDEELINVVKTNDKICKYFDIPIQHISDNVLSNMHRKSNGESIKKLIKHIRSEIPNVIIRTTLIAGFPGETDSDFKELCDFVRDYRIDKLGCFSYSKEDRTLAATMKDQVPAKIKNSRKNIIMEIQQKISKEVLDSKVGNTYKVILDSVTDDYKYFIARSYMDVPSEDGVIFIPYNSDYLINEFVTCKITNSFEYDLAGVIVEENAN